METPIELFKVVEKIVIDKNGVASFDTWGNESRKEIYKKLAGLLFRGYNAFAGEQSFYFIYSIPPTSGRGGMDEGSPHTIMVIKANIYVKDENSKF